jgi:indolepyruvate ferredoxin oxidoreductase beta subunit
MTSSSAQRPTTVLLSALGGEGGGVLSKWVVDAAEHHDLRVQFTSIPGVAQRTGATTYYIEIFPEAVGSGEGRAPVMALTPSPGNVDVMVSSELVEAGRAMLNGFVTPDRTTLIASNHRVFAVGEKTAMGDGRFNSDRVLAAARELAKTAVITDMGRLARETGSVINAVLLGALAATGVLPMSREAFEQAITQGGIAVEANLKGFAAGYATVRGGTVIEAPEDDTVKPVATKSAPFADRIARELPEPVQMTASLGVARARDYQSKRYARRYLDRLTDIVAADKEANGQVRGFALSVLVARRLATWMTYEDVIRVADLKTRRSRFDRVRREVGAGADQPVVVSDLLKPGPEEWASVMPGLLARPVMALARNPKWDRRLRFGMHLKTTSVSGFLMMWLLSKWRPLRPLSFRFGEEQALIERWLAAVKRTAGLNYELACEVAEAARLIKGYGDTHQRGTSNFHRLMAALPGVESHADGAARLKALCDAALADPEGTALTDALSQYNTGASVPPRAMAAE